MTKKHFFIIVCLVLLFPALWIDYRNNNDPGVSLFENLQHFDSKNYISSLHFEPHQLSLTANSLDDAFLSFPYAASFSTWKRLRIHFSELAGINSISVFYRNQGDPGYYPSKFRKRVIKRVNKTDCDILLPPGKYTHLRLDFNGYRPDAKVAITDIRIHDLSIFFYTGSYFHLLTLCILGLFILPGSMLYTTFVRRETADPESNLVLFFSLSILFFLILYLVLEVSHRLALNPHLSVSLACLFLLGVMAWRILRQGRMPLLRLLLVSEKRAFLATAILSVVCGVLATGFTRTPFSFDSVNWGTIHGATIFSNFTGHDNSFQYVNGMAIAENEPFSKYYADNQMMADVQDREMLAGVIYAVFRTLIGAVSSVAGESYLTYTLVGLCMNVMIIFPLIVLLRRYFGRCNEYLFSLFLSMNAFVLGNYYFTWFKFAGAALFISGILVLLRSRDSLYSWLFAGLAWGMATNMHAGNALGIPVIFLFIVYLKYKDDGVFSKTTVVYPTALFLAFVVANLPWTVVKSLYHPDHHSLLKFHYLPGSSSEENMVSAVKTFISLHPLSEQIRYRLANLCNILQFSEWNDLFRNLKLETTTQLLFRLSNSEFFYFSIAIFSSASIAILSFIATALRRLRSSASYSPMARSLAFEYGGLMVASFVTVACLILLSYHKHPDLTYHLPMGIILIIITQLIGYSMKSGWFGMGLLVSSSIFSLWRFGCIFLHFV